MQPRQGRSDCAAGTTDRRARTGLACFQGAELGDNALLAQIGHEGGEAAKLKIATEYDPHPLGLCLVDLDLAILGIVAEWHHPADPQALALGGGDLVADALGSDLAFE